MAKYLDEIGLAHFWQNIKDRIGGASQAQVNEWLDSHPEATTTVQDGAISTIKLTDDAVTTNKLADGAVTTDKIDQSIRMTRITNEMIRNILS